MPKLNPRFEKMLGNTFTRQLESSGAVSARALKNLEVVASRAADISGGTGPQAASTVGTICTADTISTASSVCAAANDFASLAEREPELMKAVTTLHERAISELGEDGLAEAMAKMSK